MTNSSRRIRIEDIIPKETFYRVPKQLLNSQLYQDLSNESILVYAIFQDRFELSARNKWIDNNNAIYFIYTIEELGKIIKRSKPTVIKIKKELVRYGLLEEEYVGLNQPNRLYILSPVEKTSDSKYSGGKDFLPPEVKKLYSNDTEYNNTIDTNNDTIRDLRQLEKKNLHKIIQSELVSQETAQFLSIIGNGILVKEYADIIYLTKNKVENFQNKENPKSNRYIIYGDIWKESIELKAKKFYFKLKEYQHKNKPMNNPKKYWMSTMETFWENVLLMEKKYGTTELDILYNSNQLELEENFVEFNAITKNMSKKEKRKVRFEMIYEEPFH